MNRKLKSALKQNFTPPNTQRREQFIHSVSYPKEKTRDVFILQIGFIRKRVWCLFAVSVCFAFFYTNVAEMPESIVSGVSAILPLFSLCIISEIYKSCACNMEEMELACKYNLSKITLMRLSILGTVSFATLLLLVLSVASSDFGALRNTLYLAAPYLLSSYVSLWFIAKLRSKETIYICALVSGAVSISILIANNTYPFIYKENFAFLWVLACVVLAGLLFVSLIRFTKLQEELQWSLL